MVLEIFIFESELFNLSTIPKNNTEYSIDPMPTGSNNLYFLIESNPILDSLAARSIRNISNGLTILVRICAEIAAAQGDLTLTS
jgi:hypothetical protein